MLIIKTEEPISCKSSQYNIEIQMIYRNMTIVFSIIYAEVHLFVFKFSINLVTWFFFMASRSSVHSPLNVNVVSVTLQPSQEFKEESLQTVRS